MLLETVILAIGAACVVGATWLRIREEYQMKAEYQGVSHTLEEEKAYSVQKKKKDTKLESKELPSFELSEPSLLEQVADVRDSLLPKAVYPYQRSLEHFAPEILRAYRHDRSVTIVVLGAEGNRFPDRFNYERNLLANLWDQEFVSKYLMPLIGLTLQNDLRNSDILTYDKKRDRYVLLLPETKIEQVQSFMARWQTDRILKHTGTTISFGMAELPADSYLIKSIKGYPDLTECARIIEELVALADRRSSQSPYPHFTDMVVAAQ